MSRLHSRLQALEAARPEYRDARDMTDAELLAVVRRGVRKLEALPARTDAEEQELAYLRMALEDDTCEP